MSRSRFVLSLVFTLMVVAFSGSALAADAWPSKHSRPYTLTASYSAKMPYVFLVLTSMDGCSLSPYEDKASNVMREKDLGTYSVLVAQVAEEDLKTIDPQSDDCLEMFFPVTDFRSLHSMMIALNKSLKAFLQEANLSETLEENFPGTCEEVADYIAKRFPDQADAAYEKCEELNAMQAAEGGEGSDDLLYESDDNSCTTVPDMTCAPGMSGSEYIRYTMDYVTPNDPDVVEEAQQFDNIEDLYVSMQRRPWQSDSSLFGCSDKFQKPNYYLGVAPSLRSSMQCESAVGDCDDKANSFASLLIASGLLEESEVRVAMGMVDFGGLPGGHAWTEIYMDGHWFVVDSVMGSTCYDTGKCYIYTDEELKEYYPWDYYNYVKYPVIEYWGWANSEWYYDMATHLGSPGAPAYWSQKATTSYSSL